MKRIIICLVVVASFMGAAAFGGIIDPVTNNNLNTNANVNTNTNLNTNVQGQEQGQLQGQSQLSFNDWQINPKTMVPNEAAENVTPATVNIYDNSGNFGKVKGVVFWTKDTEVTGKIKTEKWGTYGGMINRWEVYQHILKTVNALKDNAVYKDKTIIVKVTGRSVVKTYAPIPNVGGAANPASSSAITGGGSFGVSISFGDEWDVIEYLY